MRFKISLIIMGVIALIALALIAIPNNSRRQSASSSEVLNEIVELRELLTLQNNSGEFETVSDTVIMEQYETLKESLESAITEINNLEVNNTEMSDEIKQLIASLNLDLSDIINNLDISFQKYLDIFAEFADGSRDASKETDDLILDLMGDLKNVSDQLNKTLDTMSKELGIEFKNIEKQHIELLDAILMNLGDIYADIIMQFETQNTYLEESFSDVSGNMISNFTNLTNSQNESFSNLTSNLGDNFSNLFNTQNNSFNDLSSYMESSFTDLTTNMGDRFTTLTNIQNESFTDLSTNIGDSFTTLTNTQNESFSDLSTNIETRITDLQVNMGDTFNSITNNFNDSNDDLVGQIANLEAKIDAELLRLFQSVSNGKSLVASTITDRGVSTATDATFSTINENIKNLYIKAIAECAHTPDNPDIEYEYHYHVNGQGGRPGTEAVSIPQQGGCYNTTLRHIHSGSATAGLGCYTTPVYHVHTGSNSARTGCYQGSSYQTVVGTQTGWICGDPNNCINQGGGHDGGHWQTWNVYGTRYNLNCGKTPGVTVDSYNLGCGMEQEQIIGYGANCGRHNGEIISAKIIFGIQ